MTEFFVVLVLLCSLAVLFLFMPFLLKSVARQRSLVRANSNVLAYEERMAELEAECELADYSTEEVERLKRDLQRRLLEDVEGRDSAAAADDKLQDGGRTPWSLMLLLACLLPVSAVLFYKHTGAQSELMVRDQVVQLQRTANPDQARVQTEALIKNIEKLLEADDNRPHYLMLLGRSYMQLRNYGSAESAFQRLMLQTGEDPTVMGLYAQARYMAAGRRLDEGTRSLAERVLELQPFNGTVLGMLGIAHFEQGDYAQAVDYWQRLLKVLDPNSGTAQMIQSGVAQAKQALAESGEGVAAVPGKSEPSGDDEAVVELQVAVSLAEELRADQQASVFVYARAVNGPKMPLAVARLRVSELPAKVILNDSMAMAPGLKLSSFDQVEVIARISKQGIANAAAGDLEGRSDPLRTGGRQVVNVIISNILP